MRRANRNASEPERGVNTATSMWQAPASADALSRTSPRNTQQELPKQEDLTAQQAASATSDLTAQQAARETHLLYLSRLCTWGSGFAFSHRVRIAWE
jgi:hypothetical protein